jgi:hypothetical protein
VLLCWMLCAVALDVLCCCALGCIYY